MVVYLHGDGAQNRDTDAGLCSEKKMPESRARYDTQNVDGTFGG